MTGKPKALRLPARLAFTAVHVAVAGGLGCSGESPAPRADGGVMDGSVACDAGLSCSSLAEGGVCTDEAVCCPLQVCDLSECPIACGFV